MSGIEYTCYDCNEDFSGDYEACPFCHGDNVYKSVAQVQSESETEDEDEDECTI